MTLDIVKNHFLNIGKSYYKSNEYLYNDYAYKPIGQYGIGFLSCFLLSDNVIVRTRHFSKTETYQIELEKKSEYVVTKEEQSVIALGTEISLEYDKVFNVFKSTEELKRFLSTFFYTDISIKIKDEDMNNLEEIKNNSEEILQNYLDSGDSKNNEIIICSNYSTKIKGKIALIYEKDKNTSIIMSTSDYDMFLYNSKEGKFHKVEELETGYYQYMCYSPISKNKYDGIMNTRLKFVGTKRDATKKDLLTNGDNGEKRRILIFKQEDMLPFGYFTNGNGDEDGIGLKSILEKSGLEYYKALLDYNNFHLIFFKGKQGLRLTHSSYNDGMVYRRPVFGEFSRSRVYYKDILVKDFRSIECLLPFRCQVAGYINYFANDIKLDVSRNRIIEGNINLRLEINNIILKYI